MLVAPSAATTKAMGACTHLTPDAFASTCPAAKEPARASRTLILGSMPSVVLTPAPTWAAPDARPRTLEMPARPARPPHVSPTAGSVALPPVAPLADDVLFPGERIARLDDFVRLHVASRKVTFLRVLESEGITPREYAALCARFQAALRGDPHLRERYARRLAAADRRA